MRKILVIEDMEGMRIALGRYLERLREKFPHAEISFVGTLADAWRILREIPAPDVTFLDLGLPDSEWHKTIESISEIDSLSPVIVMTGYPESKVREMMGRPDIDILEKGTSMWGKLWEAIARAVSRSIHSENMDRVDHNIRLLRAMISPDAKQ